MSLIKRNLSSLIYFLTSFPIHVISIFLYIELKNEKKTKGLKTKAVCRDVPIQKFKVALFNPTSHLSNLQPCSLLTWMCTPIRGDLYVSLLLLGSRETIYFRDICWHKEKCMLNVDLWKMKHKTSWVWTGPYTIGIKLNSGIWKLNRQILCIEMGLQIFEPCLRKRQGPL